MRREGVLNVIVAVTAASVHRQTPSREFTRVIQRAGRWSVLIARLKPRLGTCRERGAATEGAVITF